MKLCRYDDNRIGVIRHDTVHDITPLFEALGAPGWPYPPHDWIIGNFPQVQERIAGFLETAATRPLGSVTLQAPVANPGKIIGVPINYKDHIDEANADKEITQGKVYTTIDQYGLFIKAPTALLGPSGTVVIPYADRRTDHEVELGIVIGRRAKDVPRAEAHNYIFGYCVALDMTIRGAEFPGFRKSPDTFAVIGPWITTADEVPDPDALALELKVNGVVRQKANTRQLITNVAQIIEYASRHYTLHPGDVIMTGTPAGVGPVQPGDRMWASVEGLGELNIAIAQ
jgi:2-keto-4-pentenoate hydratase/2-oxohepta-3-ene-1,7-dioic acid hydratase in catechol pathway